MLRIAVTCVLAAFCAAADLESVLVEACAIDSAQPEEVALPLRVQASTDRQVRVLLRPRFPGAPAIASAVEGSLRIDVTQVAGAFTIVVRRMPSSLGDWSPASTTWAWQELSRVRHVRTGAWEHRPWPEGAGVAKAMAEPVAARIDVAADGAVDVKLIDPSLLADLVAGRCGGLILAADGQGSAAIAVKDLLLRDVVESRPTVAIPVVMPAGSDRLSMRIVDASGRAVRELLHAVAMPPGQRTVAWDGLDDAGNPVPQGAYRWLAATHAGLRAEYLMTLGLSVDHQLLWPGNHIGVSGLAVDAGRDRVYLGSGCSEAHGFLVAMDGAGGRQWTNPEFWFDAWKGADAMAVDGDVVFMLQLDGRLYRVGARDGRRVGAGWSLMPAGKPVRKPDADRSWEAMKQGRMHGGNVAYLDVAAGSGRLAVSCELYDLIRFVDPANGTVLREVRVPEPRGVAFAPDGSLRAISAGRIIAVADGEPRELVPARMLTDPWRLSVDPGDGSLLVVEGGASQQIVRIGSDGKVQKRYGKRGGRPAQGAYDAGGFLGVTAIAAGADGSFWVAEAYTAPRRVVHLDRAGAVIREWYGPQMYASRCFPDPADHRRVWMDSNWGEVIEAAVDYEARTWKVIGTWRYGAGYNHEDGMWFVRHVDGRTYLCDESRPRVFLVDRLKQRLVPVAEVGTAFYPGGNGGWKVPEDFRPGPGQWDETGARFRDPKDVRSHQPWSFWWSDADGDGVREGSEAVWDKLLLRFPRTSYVDDRLVYHTHLSISWKEQGAWQGRDQPQGIGIMSPTWSRVAPVYAASGLSFIDKDSQRGAMCSWLDTDGARWATDGRRTSRWSPQGKLLWTVGRPTTASRPGPGETKTIHRFIGTAHGVGAVAEIHNSDSAVWDRNGLWIGRLLEQPDLSHADPQAYALCGENFGGVMIEEPGRPASALYYGGTPNAVAVFRITGFDRIQSSSGSVSPPQP